MRQSKTTSVQNATKCFITRCAFISSFFFFFFFFFFLRIVHERREKEKVYFQFCFSITPKLGFCLSLQLNLKLHMKIHNKCHTCPVCDHTFAQLSFLNKHLLKHQDHKDNSERKWNDIDGAENVYQCEWDGCLFRSKYRNVLKRHFDSLHQGQKHSVQEEPSVSDEQVEEHTGNTNEKCDRCGKLFAERFELRNHMFDKHDLVLQVESETESESQVA